MLAIEHLSVEYFRAGRVVPAVRDVSLKIAAGESLGLVGESGSGKSTVALSILRLIRPQEGRILRGQILFQGKDLLALPEEAMRQVRGREIAMIFQDPFTSLNPVLRIEAQLGELLEAHRLPVEKGILADALVAVQLDAGRVLASYPHQLSGGQRQRVVIALALLAKPKLILADEPTTALDVLAQKDILDLLFSLQKRTGVGVLFVSHNLALVAERTQRIAVMRDGQIVEEGASQDLFRHPRDPYTQQLLAAVPRL